MPVIHAIEKSTFNEKKLIIKYLNNPTKSNLNNLLEIIQEKKGIEYSQERMKDFKNTALDILYSNFTSNDYTKSFEKLANYIILRKNKKLLMKVIMYYFCFFITNNLFQFF